MKFINVRRVDIAGLALAGVALLLLAGGCNSGKKELTLEQQVAEAMELGDPGSRTQKLISLSKKQIAAGASAGAIETLSLAQKSGLEVDQPIQRATIFNSIAILLADLKQTSSAKDAFKEVSDVYPTIENSFSRSTVVLEMALGYSKLGTSGAAMSSYYLKQASAEADKIEDPASKVTFQSKIASAFVDLGEKDKAVEVIEGVVTGARGSSDPRTCCDQLAGAAMVFHGIGQGDRATELLEEAVSQVTKIQEPASRTHALAELALKYKKTGDGNQSKSLFDRAEQESDKIVDTGLKEEVDNKIRKYKAQ